MQYASVTNENTVGRVNAIARDTMTRRSVPVVDPFLLSSYGGTYELHTDRAHLHGKNDLYYRTLASLLISVDYWEEKTDAEKARQEAGLSRG